MNKKNESKEYKFKSPDEVCNRIGKNEHQRILKHRRNYNKIYGFN